jgi:hypothetical protein
MSALVWAEIPVAPADVEKLEPLGECYMLTFRNWCGHELCVVASRETVAGMLWP